VSPGAAAAGAAATVVNRSGGEFDRVQAVVVRGVRELKPLPLFERPPALVGGVADDADVARLELRREVVDAFLLA
jgi:hypothetical protein